MRFKIVRRSRISAVPVSFSANRTIYNIERIVLFYDCGSIKCGAIKCIKVWEGFDEQDKRCGVSNRG